jgi:hypothetical protein
MFRPDGYAPGASADSSASIPETWPGSSSRSNRKHPNNIQGDTMTTINESWSARPSSTSGHASAAPPIRRGKAQAPTFTIDGLTPEQIRQQGQDRAQQQVPVPQNVAEAYAAQINAAKAFEQHLANVQADDGLTPQGREDRIAKFADTPAAQAVDQAHEVAQRHAADAKASVEAVRDSLTQPGDSAQELRNSRIWNRAKAALDNAEDGRVGAVARQLISSADRETLGVLHEELPSYLASRDVESDWLTTAFEQSVPELAQAQADADKAQKHADVISYNHQALKRGFNSGSVPPKLVDPSVVG